AVVPPRWEAFSMMPTLAPPSAATSAEVRPAHPEPMTRRSSCFSQVLTEDNSGARVFIATFQLLKNQSQSCHLRHCDQSESRMHYPAHANQGGEQARGELRLSDDLASR